MIRLLFLTIITGFAYTLHGQYWSRLFDNGPNSLDGMEVIEAYEDEVVTLSYVAILGVGNGGIVFKRVNRNSGMTMAKAVFIYEDSISTMGGVHRITPNRYAMLYTIGAWGGVIGGKYTLHYVDSLGNTLGLYRFNGYSFPSAYGSTAKTQNGFLYANTTLGTLASVNSHLEYVGQNGKSRWHRTVDSTSTRYFNAAHYVNDTLVLLQSTGGRPCVLMFDTLGNELKRNCYTEHEDYFCVDMRVSRDSSKYLIGGYIRPQNSNPQAVMVLDRGLNKLDFATYDVGTRAIGRRIEENRFGDYLFIGHSRDEVLYDGRDNAFVMRINPDGLTQESLQFFSPSGDLKDNQLQIIVASGLEDSILYIGGHGGITATTGTQDEWILALTDLGTCDTADCFPWLVAGMEEVPSEWMNDWSIGTGTDGWHVRLDRPELHQPGSEMVVVNLLGQKIFQRPIEAAVFRIPFTQLPTGTYIVQWQQGSKRMYKRVLRP
jgi:hypothetical protein